MDIQKKSTAGTLESCDCFVMVQPHGSLEIRLDSVVEKRYGDYLYQIIRQTIEELDVHRGLFMITDRGALDYCVKARITTAVNRGQEKC